MNTVIGSRDSAAELLPLYEADALEQEAANQYEKRDWNKAAALYEQSLQIRQKCCGPQDPNTARLLDELGQTLLRRHAAVQAERAFKLAEDLLESVYYSGHGQLAPVLEHHADALTEQGKLAEAEQPLKRAQEIYAKTRTMENRDTLRAMLKLARLYLALCQPQQAEAVIDKAMKHVDTPLGPVAEFRYQLALAYLQEGKVEEAKDLLALCVQQFKQRRNYGRVADCLEQRNRIASDAAQQADVEKYRKLSRVYPYAEDIFLATLLRA